MLSVHVARRRRPPGGGTADVLGRMELDVGAREFVTLLGPSGCGKTTLLKIIAGLDAEYDGEVRLEGAPVRGPDSRIGLVFQESRLLPWKTVAANVAFALPAGVGAARRQARVREALALVGLGHADELWPYQLSGGMEKRVGLARALVSLPPVLLLDEPFSALDAPARHALQDVVAEIHARDGLSTILVTHDVEEAVYLSDRVALLTASPSTIVEVVEVSLPRPRDRAGEAFVALRREIGRRAGAHGAAATA